MTNNQLKITKDQAIGVASRFLEQILPKDYWYQKVSEDTKAILMYGSVAKETNSHKSDIDIMVILPLESEKKYTEGEYVYKFEGHEVNVVLRSIEKLRTINFSKDNFQQEIFLNCVFLFESDDEIRNILSTCHH